MAEQHRHPSSERETAGITEIVTVTVDLHRHGSPVETIKVECEGEPTHRHLAQKLAEVLTLGVEELLEEFTEQQELYDHGRHHAKLKLECIDVHFETESATHHFPARARWKHVHRWACHNFRIANDISANLELRDGDPEGTVLNETNRIGEFNGCRTVWLVKPGPEPNGR
jgi:hypothetical protein